MSETETDAPAAGVVSLPTARRCPLDPPEEYGRIRKAGAPARVALPGGGQGWLFTRYEDVRAVLADPRFSSRTHGVAPAGDGGPARVPPGMFILMDPPEHTRYRRLLNGGFSARRIRKLLPRIEQIVEERLAAMAATGGGPVDVVREFALPIPSLVVCELLGVPYEDVAEFQRTSSTLLSLEDDAEVDAARDEVCAFIHRLVVAKRARPADDLLSELITAPDAQPPLSDEELVGMGTLLLVAGHESTASMLALGLLTLLEHPERLAALRADPDGAERVVDELLRYLTVFQFGMFRTAAEDVETAGVRIRQGETVIASLAAANRDPERFTGPDAFDPGRRRGTHLSFGHGVHQCVGLQLARVELTIALRALVRRFPGLELAVPVQKLKFREDAVVYGVEELPVRW
ncbi:cytochrome P450 [Streptomyces sp. NPDC018019]|uniref:cytochrome P450 n=1 Tax=Streptomyces sp. NPDC018019 TaxID=3365030 RepID=UPI00379DBAE2